MTGVQTCALPISPQFIPFADLTENQVVSWLETAMGVSRLADLNTTLDEKLATAINPPSEVQLPPWQQINL